MTKDPMTTFGSLLRSCIREDDQRKNGRAVLEGATLLLLGMASSVLTSYALSVLGVLV
ncbi:MAG: hypothetical protein LYZ69_00735 [Nitrososphaerales archaeon]|nr:hypothetical protein [Nitrososphaerales archaeon]